MTDIILVVDMLKGFYKIGNLANPRMENIIPNVITLLKKKSREGYKAIFLGDVHKENDIEFKTFPPHCIMETEEIDVIDELQSFLKKGKYISKNSFSGLFNTELEKALENYNVQNIIVVGVCTDICVLHTVVDLIMRGYCVVIPKDCVETFNASFHEANENNKWALNHMALIGATISNSEELK